MTGIEPLIKSVVPNPVFSETFSEAGVFVDVNTLNVKHDFRNRGAKLIVIHSIICSVDPALAGSNVCIVSDNFNKTLMQFFIHTSMGGAYTFEHIIIASEINLTFLGAGAGNAIRFTVQYQYVYDAESKVLKL